MLTIEGQMSILVSATSIDKAKKNGLKEGRKRSIKAIYHREC